MYFTIGEKSQLNDILNRICEKLQLNQTRKERVETSYNALCNFITNSEYLGQFEKLDFYAQGSYSIQTTVKPKGGNEFDLDFILEIYGEWKKENPLELLKELHRIFIDSDLYKDKVELKTRCIRINYADDFHIDILPSFPEGLCTLDTKLKVPDKEIKDWTDSNPKGYAKWFNDKCNTVIEIPVFEQKSASIEPLPEAAPYAYTKPLRRAVQLMKRYRDIYYEDKESNGVKSIVITTLAGDFYTGESDEYDCINSILDKIIRTIEDNNGQPFDIYNPTNTKEKLSEKWDSDSKSYDEFCKFIYEFKLKWNELLTLSTFQEKANVIQKLFGENISKDVLLEQAEYINKLRDAKKLAVDTTNGNLTSIIAPSNISIKEVHKNTFYGE